MGKQVLPTNPTFNPTSKTLDFSSTSGFALSKLYAVLNRTRGVIIYSPELGQGYTAFASNVLTLSYDTTTHSSGDVLTCIYDDTAESTAALQTAGNATLTSLQALTALTTSQLSSLTGASTSSLQTQQIALLQTQTSQLSSLAGAATAALQTSQLTSLQSIDAKHPALVSGRIPVDTSGVTSPISAVSLPLPNGAATSAKQPAFGTAGTPSTDVVTVQGVSGMQPFLVSGFSAVGVSPSLNPVSVSGVDGGGLKRHFLTDTSGKLQVTPDLASGAATSALQTSQITYLSSAATAALQSQQLTSLQSMDGKLPALLAVQPAGTVSGAPIRQVNPKITRHNFSAVGSGLLSSDFTQLILGTGMAVSQNYGQLIVTAGTNTNAEFMMRSATTVSGANILRWRDQMSQRILNNTMVVELADQIGTGLAFTTDGTGLNITVTFVLSNPFTSANIGQWMSIGAVSGVATYVPGRYAITAVAGLTITLSAIASCTWTRATTTATVTLQGGCFDPIYIAQTTATVSASSDTAAIVNGSVTLATQSNTAGFGSIVTFTCLNAGASSGTLTLQRNDAWTASGSGTLTLFGWNSISLSYHTASNTTGWYNSYRNGWSIGGSSISVNGSAAGQVMMNQTDGLFSNICSANNTTNTAGVFTERGSRAEDIPDDTLALYLFVRVFNGTVAPASTTTVTYGYSAIEETGNLKFAINGSVPNGASRGLRADITSLPTNASVNVAQIGAGTLAAHSAAYAGNPVPIGGRVSTALDTTLVANDVSVALFTTAQQLVTKSFGTAENDWVYVPPVGGLLNTTTAATIKAAAGASLRNYVTNLELEWEALTNATEFAIRDGSNTATSVAANVLTASAHGLAIGDVVVFTGVGSYTGISVATAYYVLTVPSTTTFSLSTTVGGSTLTITGSGSAAFNKILYRTKLGTGAGRKSIAFPTPPKGNLNTAIEIVTLTASGAGAVYANPSGYASF